MKNKIIKALIFGGNARIAAIDNTEMVNELIKIHNLSPLAAAALGRSMTVGAYISSNFKNINNKFNMIIDGKGPIGQIYIAGNGKNEIKGFVENPQVDLPSKNGKLDVGAAVGVQGNITIIEDLGLKDVYRGSSKLVSGEIGQDFANYLFTSQGVPNAVVLGVLIDNSGCLASGGLILELMPEADENQVFILEDIVSLLSNFSSLLKEKNINELLDYYFKHFDLKILETKELTFFCDCKSKIRDIILSIGKDECLEIIEHEGKLEISCDYCASKYQFATNDIERIFT